MKGQVMRLGASLAVCLLLCSCSQQDDNRKATYPVVGIVQIDGQPAAGVKVECHDVQGIDAEQPTFSTAFTDDQGKFQFSTYASADGVPAGDYVLTFVWGKYNLVSRAYEGPDKLNGRYADAAKSDQRFTVKEGEPTDLGRIELTTK